MSTAISTDAAAGACIRRLALAALTAALCLSGGAALADEALGGIDAVSLRDSGRAVPGRGDIVTHWRGDDWYFANEANRAAFEANPRAYAPAMGGNCVVSLAHGQMERGDPRMFVVVGDRIYLTRNPALRAELAARPEEIIAQATAFWKKMGR